MNHQATRKDEVKRTFSSAEGNRQRGCDLCVRQRRLCSRIVGCNGSKEESEQMEDGPGEYELVSYPLRNSMRAGVEWHKVAFWIQTKSKKGRKSR
jgi:hypothetical protein